MREAPTLDQFRERHRITDKIWKDANISWSLLCEIFADFVEREDDFSDTAALHARTLQRCHSVHSVRWRVKDPEHLLEKIVRKRATSVEKYLAITPANYTSLITDLIGLRALHLFKSDWQAVHTAITSRWLTKETPVAYVRAGDAETTREAYSSAGCKVENHKAGYRSIHYIIGTRPQRDEILAEIQVRTIFEEGWSEIDHNVRYPNFSDHQLLAIFLGVFNRLAGSADEMGSFVQSLVAEISNYESTAGEAQIKIQEQLKQIEKLAKELHERKENAPRGAALREIEALASSLREASVIPVRRFNIAFWPRNGDRQLLALPCEEAAVLDHIIHLTQCRAVSDPIHIPSRRAKADSEPSTPPTRQEGADNPSVSASSTQPSVGSTAAVTPASPPEASMPPAGASAKEPTTVSSSVQDSVKHGATTVPETHKFVLKGHEPSTSDHAHTEAHSGKQQTSKRRKKGA